MTPQDILWALSSKSTGWEQFYLNNFNSGCEVRKLGISQSDRSLGLEVSLVIILPERESGGADELKVVVPIQRSLKEIAAQRSFLNNNIITHKLFGYTTYVLLNIQNGWQ